MSFNSDSATIGARWRSPLKLWRYLLTAHVGPFLLAFTVIMFVFLLQFLMRFIDQIVGKGLDLWTIVQLIALNLAWMVVLALPMAGLVASLMAFGSLSSTQEVTAMKAAGVSFFKMLIPILVAATALAYGNLWFNNEVLPNANHRAKDLMSDIQRKKPTFVMRQGEFTPSDALPGYAIYTKKTFPNSNNLEGIVIFDHTSLSETKVITAKTATFTFTRDFANLVMNLKDGEFHQAPTVGGNQYRNGVFTTYQVRIPTSGYDFLRQESSERGDRELSASDLLKYVHSRDTVATRQKKSLLSVLGNYYKGITSLSPDPTPSAPNPNVQPPKREIGAMLRQNIFEVTTISAQTYGTLLDAGSYMVEVHKKYALPVACLVFVLVGAPLGALARRGGMGIGVGFSIGFFILYWACLIGGEKLADRGIIAPWLGMWIANIILSVLGVYLIFRVMRERQGLGISIAPLFKRFRKNV
ncbi:MAG TPA: LptF/LptG family permease [Candidatus Kapabacteria bacterium]|nr:LptF/LptG family permease [Candidatus Kapabacteria bacterium]